MMMMMRVIIQSGTIILNALFDHKLHLGHTHSRGETKNIQKNNISLLHKTR